MALFPAFSDRDVGSLFDRCLKTCVGTVGGLLLLLFTVGGYNYLLYCLVALIDN